VKLSEAKQEFTRRTQMPAKKAFAELVVAPGSLNGKRMTATVDWLWVLENMLPHWDKSTDETPLATFNAENQKQAEQIQQLVKQNESLTQALNQAEAECDRLRVEQDELLAEIEQDRQRIAQAQALPADEAEAVAIAANAVPHVVAGKIFEAVLTLNYKSWFKKLALHLHPDTTKLEKNAAQELFVILSDKYNEIKEKESFHWLDSFDYAPEAYYDPDVSDIPF
jgi:anthranilate/para-aminobenzoate synthase component I